MIATYLRAEVDSPRFGRYITEKLERDSRPRGVVSQPDLDSAGDNAYRRRIFGEYRGYGRDVSLFYAFPADVQWQRVLLSREELQAVKYLRIDYWDQLSGGSRLVADGARGVRQGNEVLGQSNANFWSAADGLATGAVFPEPILVQTTDGLVVLEGHLRLTASLLRPENCPEQLAVLVGVSEGFDAWDAIDRS